MWKCRDGQELWEETPAQPSINPYLVPSTSLSPYALLIVWSKNLKTEI